MIVKMIPALLAIVMLFFCGNVTTLASENQYNYIGEVVDVYQTEKPKDKVGSTTLSMEVDMLAEIEAFFACSKEELISMGTTEEKIDKTREELLSYYSLSDEDLAKELKINTTEASMVKKAIDAGLESYGKKLKKKSGVLASGSITASEMEYTQDVFDYSTSSAPKYRVYLSYLWKNVYNLALFEDKIAVAWGGGLNSKDYSSLIFYYDWTKVGGDFGDFYTRQSANKEETIQAGLELEFPQAVYKDLVSPMPKTKTGYIQFTLYQTQFQGYDTKVISRYCHKVISVGGGSIDISVTGASVSMDIGYGYDTTAQAEKIIGY